MATVECDTFGIANLEKFLPKSYVTPDFNKSLRVKQGSRREPPSDTPPRPEEQTLPYRDDSVLYIHPAIHSIPHCWQQRSKNPLPSTGSPAIPKIQNSNQVRPKRREKKGGLIANFFFQIYQAHPTSGLHSRVLYSSTLTPTS